MFKILNELVEIPINDRLIPADIESKTAIESKTVAAFKSQLVE